jgi:hypothetical protein
MPRKNENASTQPKPQPLSLDRTRPDRPFSHATEARVPGAKYLVSDEDKESVHQLDEQAEGHLSAKAPLHQGGDPSPAPVERRTAGGTGGYGPGHSKVGSPAGKQYSPTKP